MRNAFLGKVRLNQGKIIFRLKVIKKAAEEAFIPPTYTLSKKYYCDIEICYKGHVFVNS